MSRPPHPIDTSALLQRLQVVATALGVDAPPDLVVGSLLAELADQAAARADHRSAWLLLTATAGAYPDPADVLELRRALELARPAERLGAVLTAAGPAATRARGDVTAVAVPGVIVDVDFCARHTHNTGIQRVVRNTVKHWRSLGASFVAWSADGSGYRLLLPEQEDLVFAWHSGRELPQAVTDDEPLVIPLDARVLLVEVPGGDHLEQLTAMAAYSGCTFGLIGYDAIPVVSADLVDEVESDRFAKYLTVVKHSKVISCISATTAEEFGGFVDTLANQGFSGPLVTALPLPEVAPDRPRGQTAPRDRPLVVMAGSIEPRKNQEAVLAAAQVLWAEGLDFELVFLGGGTSWNLRRLRRAVDEAVRAGASVSVRVGAPDDVLAAAYRDARVVVFPSLQEGYGLPVAEALASGTPVITTRYGSTGEIAAAGGCLVVDPRDDDEIADALRAVLTDDELRARLVQQIARRPQSTWAIYAERLWGDLVTEVP